MSDTVITERLKNKVFYGMALSMYYLMFRQQLVRIAPVATPATNNLLEFQEFSFVSKSSVICAQNVSSLYYSDFNNLKYICEELILFIILSNLAY